jgi:small subunit ribosomal protein S20
LPAKATPKKNLSAIKRSRQAEKQNLRNRAVRSTIKTVVKKVETAVVAGKKEEAGNELILAIKALTKAASKGVIHRNTASRNISRLSRKVNAIPAAGAA